MKIKYIQSASPQILSDLSRLFGQKKWGILIKKESASLDFTELKIPRDYTFANGGFFSGLLFS